MENAPILLVPGFFLFILVRAYNKKLTQSDGIRFIISVFLTSTILLTLGGLISEISSLEVPVILQNSLGRTLKEIKVSTFLNSIFSALVIFLFTKIDTTTVGKKLVEMPYFKRRISENSQEAKFYAFIYYILIQLDKKVLLTIRCYLNKILNLVFLSDDSVHCNEFEKLHKKLVLITLRNEKIYIGRVESADINIVANTDDIVKIIPVYSGYRDELKKVHITTEYELESKKNEIETSISIFKREITSISPFDTSLAKLFMAHSMLHNDVVKRRTIGVKFII